MFTAFLQVVKLIKTNTMEGPVPPTNEYDGGTSPTYERIRWRDQSHLRTNTLEGPVPPTNEYVGGTSPSYERIR